MLLGGDELCRTQHGNNNAWCQDNELSWYDWESGRRRSRLRDFVRRLIRLRRQHPVSPRELPRGQPVEGSALPDVWWFRVDGRAHDPPRLGRTGTAVLGHVPQRRGDPGRGPHGEEISDDSFLVLFNAHYEDGSSSCPAPRMGVRWELELDTADPDGAGRQRDL